ncbi:MAG TPA: ABC transporter ATP-binding protein [Thermomicrobiales bacterium]|nr:ABC transporter ATP-binding protein [Thermomicrobiales bacterium]
MASPALPSLTESPPARPEPTAPFLDVRDVTSTYVEGRTRLTALENLSLAVARAEFVAIIGPSGCGKSTLLDIVAGLIEPERGAIVIDGRATTAAQRLGLAGYMHQRDLLLPWRTALDNAALGLEIAGMPRNEARAAVRARLPEFGLAGFERAWPGQLSGGMRQRVAFLRTVLTDRPLLLLDEPFGALDALTRADLQNWLVALWERERRSVLLVTHDVDEAIFLADRVVVLTPRPGRVALVETIALPRPRQRAVVTSPAFARHKTAILDALGLLDSEAP